MPQYKSTASRLARIFKKSRDGWKKRAKQKQKKIRALETKVRDLNRSRDGWKEKAKQAQRELEQLQAEQKSEEDQDSQAKGDRSASEQMLVEGLAQEGLYPPVGHHYPVFLIQLAIEQVIHSLNSLRGSQKNFRLFSQFYPLPTPSFSSIRQWLLRLGLYELQQAPPYRTDWIIMLDLTIELGQLKCLVVLGVPASHLSETGFALAHQDVEVLEIAVLNRCTGEIIEQKLVELSQRIGPPLQIVSDHGSDIKKGLARYQQQNPEVICTYDVTHQMALLLEKELAHDEQYQSFLGQCTQTRHATKQTALYFLAPPKQRLKARYLNVDSYVRWAQEVLHYHSQADFSQLGACFSLDKAAMARLRSELDETALAQLAPLAGKTYPDKNSFSQHLCQHLGPEIWSQHAQPLFLAADVGRRRFEEKFGWLSRYQADIATYAQMVDLVHTLEKQVKRNGLNLSSAETFIQATQHLTLSPRLHQFRARMVDYLNSETVKIPEGQTLLATSDIIESIFGKYKLFSSERSFKEIGKMILTIPLFTTKFSTQRIKQALETIRSSDVEAWAKQVFGQSMLSKRKSLFNSPKTTQKLREAPT